MGILLRMASTSLGLWIAAALISGIHFDDEATLLLAAVLLGIVNAFVRPIAVLMTLPITLLSLGFHAVRLLQAGAARLRGRSVEPWYLRAPAAEAR